MLKIEAYPWGLALEHDLKRVVTDKGRSSPLGLVCSFSMFCSCPFNSVWDLCVCQKLTRDLTSDVSCI